MPKQKRRPDGLIERKRLIDGKTVHFYGRSVAEVESKIEAYKSSLAEQARLGESFGEVFDSWMSLREHAVKPSTLASTASACRHVREEFAALHMREITAQRINAYLRRLGDSGYARGTVRNHHDVIGSVFRHWVTYYNGDFDPVPYTTVPRNLTVKTRQPPTQEQYALIKAHPKGFGLSVWLLMYTGLRRGEMLALQWRDLDLDAALIHVTKSVWWQCGHPVVTTPKTETAIRDVPIVAPLLSLLKERQGPPDVYVCGNGPEPLTGSQYREAWGCYFRGLGLARREHIPGGNSDRWDWRCDVTAHQFRHGMASILYDAGVGEMEAQRILGHADITITRRVYTHIRQAQLSQAAARLNEYVSRNQVE